MQVDHINRDKLDNRRSNLRFATPSQNLQNRRKPRINGGDTASRFKGVTYWNPRPRWQASISIGGKKKRLGLFETEEEAARAYDEAAREAFGEYATTNQDLNLFEEPN